MSDSIKLLEPTFRVEETLPDAPRLQTPRAFVSTNHVVLHERLWAAVASAASSRNAEA